MTGFGGGLVEGAAEVNTEAGPAGGTAEGGAASGGGISTCFQSCPSSTMRAMRVPRRTLRLPSSICKDSIKGTYQLTGNILFGWFTTVCFQTSVEIKKTTTKKKTAALIFKIFKNDKAGAAAACGSVLQSCISEAAGLSPGCVRSSIRCKTNAKSFTQVHLIGHPQQRGAAKRKQHQRHFKMSSRLSVLSFYKAQLHLNRLLVFTASVGYLVSQPLILYLVTE